MRSHAHDMHRLVPIALHLAASVWVSSRRALHYGNTIPVIVIAQPSDV